MINHYQTLAIQCITKEHIRRNAIISNVLYVYLLFPFLQSVYHTAM